MLEAHGMYNLTKDPGENRVKQSAGGVGKGILRIECNVCKLWCQNLFFLNVCFMFSLRHNYSSSVSVVTHEWKITRRELGKEVSC